MDIFWSYTRFIINIFQGPEHPNPGRRYSAGGFPRTCYLPDNQKGNKVFVTPIVAHSFLDLRSKI